MPTPQQLIDSVATTIYNVAVGRLMNRTFDAKLAAAGIGYRQGTSEGLRGLIRLLTRMPFTGVGVSGINFFDDTSVALSAANERDIILVKSLQDALTLLAGAGFAPAFANSTDVDDYLWGKVHYVIFNSFIDGDLNGTLIPRRRCLQHSAPTRGRLPARRARGRRALHGRRRQLRTPAHVGDRPLVRQRRQPAQRRRDGERSGRRQERDPRR